VFSNHFDILILTIIKKNIPKHFFKKNILKNNRYYILKHPRIVKPTLHVTLSPRVQETVE